MIYMVRNLKRDIKILKKLKVDYLLTPNVSDIYRSKKITKIKLNKKKNTKIKLNKNNYKKIQKLKLTKK